MAMDTILQKLGDEIVDVDEETFDVFSQSVPSRDLGMVDAKAEALELTIAGRDFEITQSPGVLQSSRGGGTTGAAVWQTSVRLAEWLAWSENPLFKYALLGARSTALELGAGISGVVPLVLRPRIKQCFATDQSYVLKALNDNVSANSKDSKAHGKKRAKPGLQSTISTFALDWENDNVTSVLTANGVELGSDLLLAVDCIYNYALIEPLVQTCTDICKMRSQKDGDGGIEAAPTICVIAQQLRQPDVFELWLQCFHRRFRVWRLPDDLLSDGLKENSGFVVHFGILRGH
ncbi:hypothetical protein DOTSEDRAFT_71994 [Dothistroma septosporum NZE10]|uniref:Diaminohydroxyphosphoribosylamino-pyrimidine deaminase n=1 Tax=Dothistroma septosporum (strain NZE10 / CBS 128990) TaxID=675120 RepID=N1PLG3_DOTSN|nr:hypothetical protein DOTSEDRAFT_71994 [Dothistroma septosporum NZE10]